MSLREYFVRTDGASAAPNGCLTDIWTPAEEYQPCPPLRGTMPPSVCCAILYDPLNIAIESDNASAAYPSHTVISMPALSPTMTAGNIGSWAKNPGDALAPGDVLVEIETDKAQMDFEFQEEGVLAKILKESGAKDVAVGNVSRKMRYCWKH